MGREHHELDDEADFYETDFPLVAWFDFSPDTDFSDEPKGYDNAVLTTPFRDREEKRFDVWVFRIAFSLLLITCVVTQNVVGALVAIALAIVVAGRL